LNVLVCAHGAGGHKDDANMRRLAHTLEPLGLEVVRFNFGYVDRGSRRIDPMPVLMQRIAETAERHRAAGRLFLGGRSMGGRAATLLAAEGYPCDGLMLFAYPLHPAGQLENLRAAHLSRISVPVLSFNGTRDALCSRELMEREVAALPEWSQHWLEGADHSFRVLKSSGRNEAEVDWEIAEAVRRWLAQFNSGSDPELRQR
jgi:predicted alpha/beta-hydrolase family hydrolase